MAKSFKNINQVAAYIVEKYDVSRRTVINHQGPGQIEPSRGGGFSQKKVEDYAAQVWTRRVDPDAVRPDENEEVVEPGAKQLKLEADAELKRTEAELRRLKLSREKGEVVPREDFEGELGTRMLVFKTVMEVFGNEHMEALSLLFAAGEDQCREFIALVGGDPDKAAVLCQAIRQHNMSRIPDGVEMYRSQLAEGLNAFTTDEWFTEEVRAVMEAAQ